MRENAEYLCVADACKCRIPNLNLKNKQTNINEILVFGGWNYVSYDKVQLMTNDDDVNKIKITNIEHNLSPDSDII